LASNSSEPINIVSLSQGRERDSSFDLKSVIYTLRMHWKLITVMPVLSLIVAYGVLMVVPTVYKSTIELLIFDPRQQVDSTIQKRVFDTDAISINTEIEVIKSKSLALRVAKELGLESDGEIQHRSRLALWLTWLGLWDSSPARDARQTAGDVDETTAALVDKAADALLAHIQVDRVPLSYALEVSVTSENPAKSQRLAAAIADYYLAGQREAHLEAVQRVANWLRSRLDELQSRVLEAETSIEKLKAKSGLGSAGGKANVSEQQISDLNTQLMLARTDVANRGAAMEQARRVLENDGDVREIPQVMDSSFISQLHRQQSELSRREAELRDKVGGRHAEVIAARGQLDALNKTMRTEAARIFGSMKNSYDTAVQREQSLEASLQNLLAARGNSADYVKLQELQRVADADRKLYEGYLSQFREISARQPLQDASARIITPARLPSAPSSPRRVLFYGFGGAFGLAFGLMLAFLREYRQAGVKTGAEVEQTFGYPVLGVIPLINARDSAQTLVDTLFSPAGEAMRAIRFKLRRSSLEEVPKVILITSSIPGEGKSASAMLLAAVAARSGLRTALVDCDLRRHSISDAFGTPQLGLTDLLTGTPELTDVIVQIPKTDIDLVPAGTTSREVTDLLGSERMHHIIALLRERYDYVVLDTPPVLMVVDALVTASIADKILIVVEWRHTPHESISETLRMLGHDAHRVAGIVLNKVDLKQLRGYGDALAYAYGGGYPNRGEIRNAKLPTLPAN
jgi:succinoglycan biosynthesis transport protein ExoP